MEKQSHTLDILFPLGVLAAFAASAITVLLLTAGIYRNTVEQSANSFHGPTALAYVTEKIHQIDGEDSIQVGKISEIDALVFSAEYADVRYDTYIYCYDGSLRELMVRRGVEPLAELGRALIPLSDFEARNMENGVLFLSCEDEAGTVRDCYVDIRGAKIDSGTDVSLQ